MQVNVVIRMLQYLNFLSGTGKAYHCALLHCMYSLPWIALLFPLQFSLSIAEVLMEKKA